MADAGIGEAALIAAAAESAAAAGGTAATVAATLPEVVAAAAPVVAGTAAETAATAVPALALAAPEAAALTVPTAAEAAATVAPTVAATTTEAAPITLLATESQPITTGVLGTGATTATEAAPTGLLGGSEVFGPPTASGALPEPVAADAFAVPGAAETPYTSVVDTGAWDQASRGLLEKAGHWWETSSLGDKLSVGGKALGGISSASKVLAPTAGSSAGPKTTIKPGSTGQPRGGEQALAAVIENLLKRRDTYQNASYGTPAYYRPRGLLG